MRRQLFMTAALALAVGACSSIQTTQDFNPATNFSTLQTFDWMPDPPVRGDQRVDNDLVKERFRVALQEVLESKGFRKIDSGRPDFRVGYQVALEDEVDYTQLNSYWGGGWTYRGMYTRPVAGMTTVQERRYTVGALVIDIFDVESQELVWRGGGEGEVSNDDLSPEQRQERVTQAVIRVLDSFPPGE